jgi:hypothetical protein
MGWECPQRKKPAMSTKQEHQGIIAATLAYSAEVHKGSPVSTTLQAAYQTAVVGGLTFNMARSITRCGLVAVLDVQAIKRGARIAPAAPLKRRDSRLHIPH